MFRIAKDQVDITHEEEAGTRKQKKKWPKELLRKHE